MTTTRRGGTATAVLEILEAKHPCQVSLIELCDLTGQSPEAVRGAVNRLEGSGRVTSRVATAEIPSDADAAVDFHPCLWGPEGTGQRPKVKRCAMCDRGWPRYVWDPEPGRLALPREWLPASDRLNDRLDSAIAEGTFGIHVELSKTARTVRTRLVALSGSH